MRRFTDEEEQFCGSCVFHKKDGRDWICNNENSDCYGCATEYRDVCSEYQERGERSCRDKERN